MYLSFHEFAFVLLLPFPSSIDNRVVTLQTLLVPRAGRIQERVKNVSAVVEACTFHCVRDSREVELLIGKGMMVFPISLESLKERAGLHSNMAASGKLLLVRWHGRPQYIMR
jgi:hypothetical protein